MRAGLKPNFLATTLVVSPRASALAIRRCCRESVPNHARISIRAAAVSAGPAWQSSMSRLIQRSRLSDPADRAIPRSALGYAGQFLTIYLGYWCGSPPAGRHEPGGWQIGPREWGRPEPLCLAAQAGPRPDTHWQSPPGSALRGLRRHGQRKAIEACRRICGSMAKNWSGSNCVS